MAKFWTDVGKMFYAIGAIVIVINGKRVKSINYLSGHTAGVHCSSNYGSRKPKILFYPTAIGHVT